MGEATLANFALGVSLHYVLMFIETSQIIVLTVLFNLKTPANSKHVFIKVLRVVNFDLFQTENLYVDVFEETEPLNQIFDDCGFDTSNYIIAIGPLFFVIIFSMAFRLIWIGLKKIIP